VIALIRHGDPARALELQRTALAFQLTTRDQWGGLWAVELRAWALARIIEHTLAIGGGDQGKITALATETARITGGTRTLRARLGVDIAQLGPFGDESEHARTTARNVLGDQPFTTLEEQGSSLSADRYEVQQLAMGTLLPDVWGISVATVKFDPSARWSSLTSIEQDVAILAAAGWTNSEIAVRRGKSRRTVDAQIATVLQKLEIASRRDIAQFVPEDRAHRIAAETRPGSYF
jgi:DNA-binding CsgD family transcriptional regulator